MAQLQLQRPIAFFDLETTGVDAAKDRIVEIAVIKLIPDGSRHSWVKRINPEMPIPAESSAIHGIYDADIADAPTFKDIAHELKQFLHNCDLGGYNSNKFDIPALAEAFLRVNIPVDFKTRKLVDVQQVFFKKEARTLSAAYSFYCNKDLINAHSAEADVIATIDVLEAQLDKYADLGKDVNALHDFTGGDDFVDYARRMVLKNGVPVFNFGKYKGQAVEDVFRKEPQYYDWMMNADFALHTKQMISEILNKMLLKNK
ncbi:3'-5' exonuclease [Taibaiella lutea]|uniref:3'-5' exonuclease n=1 Tax=Taibaiella lutea TaxID=2608001 RepID=A0A5M6CIN0_9BACT|nr:3'-5' exonuclease [Taibaiella lutea]KAA5535058.1 3'-5' exonuclease [Taibaiella lutea]